MLNLRIKEFAYKFTKHTFICWNLKVEFLYKSFEFEIFFPKSDFFHSFIVLWCEFIVATKKNRYALSDHIQGKSVFS